MSTWVVRLDDVPADDPGGPRLAVKDAIDVSGLPTLVACEAVAVDALPAVSDAPCVAAMRAAGARVAGKTRLTELCFSADGRSEPLGLTPRNPLDPDRVPGGSSSGSAVAVVTGEADVALGTDTGGSVRIPAACCGIAGLKTTYGRIDRTGVAVLADRLDTVGPLARDVAGLVTAMRLLEPGFEPVAPQGIPRVARLRVDGVDRAVDQAVDGALAAAGWEVDDVALPDWSELDDAAGDLLMRGAARALGPLLATRADLIGRRTRDRIRRSLDTTDEQERSALDVVARWRSRLGALLADHAALVLPTIPVAPPPLREERPTRLTWLTVSFNALGWPALALPVPGGPHGLPASLQLVAGPGGEERLLGLAALQTPAAGGPRS